MEKMESHKREQRHPLDKTGINGDLNYQFPQLVHLLESSTPGGTSLGEGSDPNAELIRFLGNFDLGFPAHDVQQIEQGKDKENPVQIKTNLLSIGGPFGPLPIPYSQLVLERFNRKDRGIFWFFNIFQHRIVSLLYRVLRMYKPATDGTTVENEKYAKLSLSVLGHDAKSMRHRMSVSDRAIMGFSGIFLSGSKSKAGLEKLLTNYFKTRIWVKSFVGEWNSIPDRFHTTLGKNNTLGSSFVLGQRAWLDQTRFTISIKEISLATYMDFLPDGNGYKCLRDLTKLYAGDEFDQSVELKITEPEVPGSRLGKSSAEEEAPDFKVVDNPRLGWNFILRTSSTELSRVPVATLDLASSGFTAVRA